jgi:hypothetical protein
VKSHKRRRTRGSYLLRPLHLLRYPQGLAAGRRRGRLLLLIVFSHLFEVRGQLIHLLRSISVRPIRLPVRFKQGSGRPVLSALLNELKRLDPNETGRKFEPRPFSLILNGVGTSTSGAPSFVPVCTRCSPRLFRLAASLACSLAICSSCRRNSASSFL